MASGLDDLSDALAQAQRIAQLGNWEWDIATGRITWSDHLFRIHGLRPGEVEVSYERYLERVHPDDRERVAAAVAAASRAPGTFEFEERIVRPDGTVRHLVSRGESFADSSGRVVRLHGVCQDITEQRATEHRLARAEADAQMTGHLRALQQIADAALAHLALDDLLDTLLDRVIELLAVDNAAILLADEAPDVLVLRAAKGPEARTEEVRIPFGRGFAGRVAAERRTMTIADHAYETVANPVLRDAGIQTLLGVPLIAGDEVVGVLSVGTVTARTFTEEDVSLIELAAQRAALALLHAQLYERERGIAETLQRSLLPERLPSIRGVDVAARYQPAAYVTSVGGDWYDVLRLEDGSLILVLGDVVGHGVQAASLMSRMRHGVEAYARDGHAPGAILERLDRMVSESVRDFLATVLVAALDPSRTRMTITSAGHLPPVLVEPGGGARVLGHPGGPPIGWGAGHYPEGSVELAPGSTLVLYTDGLVERPGETIDTGLERLQAAAAHGPDEPEALADHILATLLPDAARDDVALLVVCVGGG